MILRFLKVGSFPLLFLWSVLGLSQNITVDINTYTPQQLIEDVLIDSGCITNIQVTNTVGGNFPDGDKSYGYFNSNGADLPFEKGIVLSTGKMAHVPGPNNTLSDDDAPGWVGDTDLEKALGIYNTVNATILEFDFVPNADNISFRYIFASEEYQKGNKNTCRYSDAFAFLIKPTGGTYKNIAVVPGTQTPVQVTTVHSGIPGHCPPINQTYFGGWNDRNAPINFNGQTKVLTAEASVVVNQPYHIKLVIADHNNYRYDSAVFLEGGSFNIAANLGGDRSFITNNPLCDQEIYALDATPEGRTPQGYKWFKDGMVLPGETSAQLVVSTAGVYKVEIDYGNDCMASDEILIEYSDPVEVEDTELYQCDPSGNGRTVFNLFNAERAIVNGDPLLRVYSFHKTFTNAENDISPIPNPQNYRNTQPDEVVYARAVSDYGCVGVAEVTLKTTSNSVSPYQLVACSNEGTPGIGTFYLDDITSDLQDIFGQDTQISYYPSYSDAIEQKNQINSPYNNSATGLQLIYARAAGKTGCLGTAEIFLEVVDLPEFADEGEYFYCANLFPATIQVSSGLIGQLGDVTYEWSTGETTATIEVNKVGEYSVRVIRSRIIDGREYSCENSRTIYVVPSEPASVSYGLEGQYGDQTLIIYTAGVGTYEYSLDGGAYQPNTVFEHVKPGEHILYVNDMNGCGTVRLKVYVLGFPNYFTPNGDGYNDYWTVQGLDDKNLQLSSVRIFNRYGKLVHTLRLGSSGWDGNYNGNPLPSSDYWFKAIFNDGQEYTGHFTLKR